MTDTSTILRNQYQGNGTTTEFDYQFKIMDESELKAIRTDSNGDLHPLTLGSDFSLNGVGNNNGGTITFPLSGAPLQSGEKITLYPEYKLVQNIDFTNQDKAYFKLFEEGLDRANLKIKMLKEELDRCYKHGVADDELLSTTINEFSAYALSVQSAIDNALQSSADLSSLSDTDIGTLTALANDQFLSYDSTSQKWQNVSPADARTALSLGSLALLSALPLATESELGAVEKATSAEMDNGTNDKFPDAATIKNYVDSNALGATSGTFSPTLTTTGNNFTSVNYVSSTGGYYEKSGNRIDFNLYLSISSLSKGSANGNVVVGGLPFASRASTSGTNNGIVSVSMGFGSGWVGSNPTRGMIYPNTSEIRLFSGSNGSMSVGNVVAGAGNTVYLSGTYFTE